MSTQITVTTRPAGVEDLAMDTTGANQTGTFTTPSGKVMSYTYINASHIYLPSSVRGTLSADNVNGALLKLSDRISNISTASAMTQDTTINLSGVQSEWQGQINNAVKNLGNHTLTVKFPSDSAFTMTNTLNFANFFGGKLVIDLDGSALTTGANLESMFDVSGCTHVEITGGTGDDGGAMNHSASTSGCAIRGKNTAGIFVSNITFTGVEGGTASFAMSAYNTQFVKNENVSLVNDNLLDDHSISVSDAAALIAAHNSSGTAHSSKFALYAPLASPSFTGTPTTVDLTSTSGDSQIANKKYVDDAVSGAASTLNHPTIINGADVSIGISSGGGDYGLVVKDIYGNNIIELADVGGREMEITSTSIFLTNSSLLKRINGVDYRFLTEADLSSITLSGNPTATTQSKTDNSDRIATTAFVKSVVGDYAPLASPDLTGTPTAPTAEAGTNTTQIATTAFVKTATDNAVSSYAPLASPALTGTPTAPTAEAGTNTTQIATTAFVTSAVSAARSGFGFDYANGVEHTAWYGTTQTMPNDGLLIGCFGSNALTISGKSYIFGRGSDTGTACIFVKSGTVITFPSKASSDMHIYLVPMLS